MTKKELLANVVNRVPGVSGKDAAKVIDAYVAEIISALETEARFQIYELGVLAVKARPARSGINPRTGARLEIPAHLTVKLNPAKALLEKLNAAGK